MGKKGGLLGNIFTVGAFTMLSRVLGLGREMLQSRLVGADVEQSAFALAFMLPNTMRKLFGEGALTAAFVPIFRGEVEQVGLEKATRLARAVMTMVLLLLAGIVAVSLVGVIGACFCAEFFDFADRTRLTLPLVAILLPYMIAICGAAFGMSVLNALGRFKASSFMPSLLNIVWITTLGVLWFVPALSVVTRVRIVACGILLGGLAQFVFMFACMVCAGVTPWPSFAGWRDEKVKLVWRNLAIGAAGAGAIHANYLLDQALAQYAAPWAAGVIGFAERLMDLPLGVIGVAFGTVLLPTFSGHFAQDDLDGARAALRASVCNMLFIMLPSAAGLFVLAPELTRVIYEGGQFDPQATMRVARSVSVYALGLGFFGLQKAFVPWFQAQKDMKTPLNVSLVTVGVNATINILAVVFLPVEWRHVGLAGSTVVCAVLAVVLLVRFAHRKNGALGLGDCVPYVLRVAVASLAMAAAVWYVRGAIVLSPVATLIVTVGTGLAVYGALAVALGIVWRRRKTNLHGD